MALSHEDRAAVTDLVAMHGHVVDSGQLDRLDELFTADVVYDVTDFGQQQPLVGTAAVRDAALALGERSPVGHHVTNTVLTEIADGRVRALSKGIGVNADGTCGSVTYEDTLVLGPGGWRIALRRVRANRAPLGAG